jgi:hypothetical protein
VSREVQEASDFLCDKVAFVSQKIKERLCCNNSKSNTQIKQFNFQYSTLPTRLVCCLVMRLGENVKIVRHSRIYEFNRPDSKFFIRAGLSSSKRTFFY